MKTLQIIWMSLLSLGIAVGGGKHSLIMAPMSRQHDLQGKPQRVFEKTYEHDEGKAAKLVSTEIYEYGADGDALRIERFDEAGKKTSSETYQYDKEGTWIALVEQEGTGLPVTFQIFLDPPSKQIAHVNSKAKQTEFYKYSEQGFELGTVLKEASGREIERTTFKRNERGKEENVVFEEPPGRKTTEISVQWSDKGFETRSIMTLHDQDGDTFTSTFQYPEVDEAGNWLVRIKTTVLRLSDGRTVNLTVETTKREIKYHP